MHFRTWKISPTMAWPGPDESTPLLGKNLISHSFELIQTPVTAVTDPVRVIGDTSIVNMVRRACKKVLFEPGDTRQQWKGEAAASLV